MKSRSINDFCTVLGAVLALYLIGAQWFDPWLEEKLNLERWQIAFSIGCLAIIIAFVACLIVSLTARDRAFKVRVKPDNQETRELLTATVSAAVPGKETIDNLEMKKQFTDMFNTFVANFRRCIRELARETVFTSDRGTLKNHFVEINRLRTVSLEDVAKFRKICELASSKWRPPIEQYIGIVSELNGTLELMADKKYSVEVTFDRAAASMYRLLERILLIRNLLGGNEYRK